MKQKSLLITGAGKGLGLAITKYFLKKGWNVYGLVRSKEDASLLETLGAVAIISDVTRDSVAEDISSAVSYRLSVVINNAGVTGAGSSVEKTDAEDILNLLNVHSFGAFRVCKATLPLLEPTGLILNITSRFGSIARTASGEFDELTCSYSYRIAKAAQNMMTQTLSREYKDSGIRISALHPGKLTTRTASIDADRTPEEAAQRIFELTKTAKTGRFYSLFEGESLW